MKQLELGFGEVRFTTDSAKLEWVRSVRRLPMGQTNNFDVWPLPKLMSDEHSKVLYQGALYEDTKTPEKNIPIIVNKDRIMR